MGDETFHCYFLGIGPNKRSFLHAKKVGVLATEAEGTWRVGDKKGGCSERFGPVGFI